MKSCNDVKMVISTLLDGACDGKKVPDIIDHIFHCESCKIFYLGARQLDRRLDEVRTPNEKTMPGVLWRQISEESELRPKTFGLHRLPFWVPVLAAAVFLLLFGLGTYRWLFPPAATLADRTLNVVLESKPERMNDRRFVTIARELLESERKYQFKMYEVMKDITSQYPRVEGSQPGEGDEREYEEGVRRGSNSESGAKI